MILRLVSMCALLIAGCNALSWKKVVDADPPPGMETVEILDAQKEQVLSVSKLPPSEVETKDKLVPGDFIAIKVYKQPELSIELSIPLSGEVNYPVIGTVKLAGRTIEKIEADVKSRLEAKKLVNARVTVLIKSHNKRSVYVLGSIKNPGEYEIYFGKTLSLLQAVSKAGGFEEDADRDKLLLMRSNNGKRTAYRIPYKEIVKQGAMDKDVILMDGDILIVPERAKFYVLGKVNAPGGFMIPLSEKLTLTKAVSLAKGVSATGSASKTTVIRNLPDGTTHIFRVNINDIFNGTLRDPVILPGDTIFVPESMF